MSTNSIGQKQKGFTIIEVVLVLAIAGLIFLIVFLALPQLQKSRRDTQRKNDVGRILSAMENYSSNNGGSYPTTTTAIDSYISNIKDPSTGTKYNLSIPTTSSAPSTLGDMFYATSATCGTGSDVGKVMVSGSNSRQIAVSIYLETGGAYCQQNS